MVKTELMNGIWLRLIRFYDEVTFCDTYLCTIEKL